MFSGLKEIGEEALNLLSLAFLCIGPALIVTTHCASKHSITKVSHLFLHVFVNLYLDISVQSFKGGVTFWEICL